MHSENYLHQVREQYENFPYPERNPDDEKHRLISASPDCLDKINYYCFEGKQSFNNNFRVLVAGGGTGDSTIFLAEQLREYDAEIVHLDMTKASMDIAKQRASVRKLNNITWMHTSLLDLPDLDVGDFDYINCSGVLHHLESPQQGLAALNTVLKEDGAMMIMVYAKYGRTAIYQMQELMRQINKDEEDLNVRVENCRAILDSLPDSHWYQHSRSAFPDEETKKSIELYDLFLHSQDRAYSVPELYEYVENEGLNILRLLPSRSHHGNALYRPETYIKDDNVLKLVKTFPEREQQSIAEMLNGMLIKHTFYAAKESKSPPSLKNPDVVPVVDINASEGTYSALYAAACAASDEVVLNNNQTGTTVRFPKGKFTEALFKNIDGESSLREIYSKIMSSPKFKKFRPTAPLLHAEFKTIFRALFEHHWMFLRDKSGAKLVHTKALQDRL